MKELIEEVFKDLTIPIYYIKRPQGCNYCVVYSYREEIGAESDGNEEQTKYDIYFNFITTKNLTSDTNKIKEKLKENRFRKITINSPVQIDGQDFYQVTMSYTKIINNI